MLLFKKSHRERIALLALYKIAIVSESLIKKKQSNMSSQKINDLLEKIDIFRHVFDSFHCFTPLYAHEQIAPVALRSVTLF